MCIHAYTYIIRTERGDSFGCGSGGSQLYCKSWSWSSVLIRSLAQLAQSCALWLRQPTHRARLSAHRGGGGGEERIARTHRRLAEIWRGRWVCLNGELEIVRVSLRLRIIGQNDGEEGEAVKLLGYAEFLNPRSQSSLPSSELYRFLSRFLTNISKFTRIRVQVSIYILHYLLILNYFHLPKIQIKLKIRWKIDVNNKFGEGEWM